MAVISIFPNNESYQILASDIVANKVVGLQSSDAVGKIIYVKDTGKIYTINPDYTLSAYAPNSSQSATSSASCTRPNDTTAYTSLDVIGESPATNLIFTNVYPIAGSIVIINRVELMVNVAAIPSGMSSFRLHLYDTAPTPIADNAVFNIISGDRTKYLGFIDIDTPYDMGDTLYIDMKGVNCQVKLATGSTTLYGVMQTIGAYTPTASAVKTVKLHTLGV